MAPWKGADTLVKAVSLLRQRDIPATAKLVGPWPSPEYRNHVEGLIQSLSLQEAVAITGKVSREELWQNYASAQVFCLMSQCESFGIPAVEAQAFGTPVVGANVCAMPEIGGEGGVFGPPTDSESTADLLESVLTESETWDRLSTAARENVKRFDWDVCSRPLLRIVNEEYNHDSDPNCGSPQNRSESLEEIESTIN